jgi:hypothetical protein
LPLPPLRRYFRRHFIAAIISLFQLIIFDAIAATFSSPLQLSAARLSLRQLAIFCRHILELPPLLMPFSGADSRLQPLSSRQRRLPAAIYASRHFSH